MVFVIIRHMSKDIKMLLQGMPEDIEAFYLNHKKKVFTYLVHKLPTKEDAEEILQDVFLEALDSLVFFEAKSSLDTWLHSIAHHKVVDFYRKRKIKSFVLSKFPFLNMYAQEVSEPEFQFEKNKVRDTIEKTLCKVSANYRQILKMHYEEDLPVKQIALELNLSFKATESLLYRARKDFIKKYEEE